MDWVGFDMWCGVGGFGGWWWGGCALVFGVGVVGGGCGCVVCVGLGYAGFYWGFASGVVRGCN